ncbi:MAG: SOS response-associated peptidase [Verrucomicrobia bacterium]|nr:SOS response-associated peptidase [Verrucomicrobiota bacterium]
MCGRYVLKRKDLEALMAQLGVKDPRDFVSRYNIAPGTVIPAIRLRQDTGEREAVGLQWGLVPFWAKDASGGARMANARSEGIAGKPSFREPFRRRRCLVPASGFYEWQTLGRLKHPWFFQLSDERPFVLAGLWDRWRSTDGVELETCSLITTTANPVVGALHDRMPVILQGDAVETWLDSTIDNPGRLEALLRPLPGDLMKATAVSPKMNNVRYEAPDCIEPVPPPAPAPESTGRQLGLDLG